MADFKDELSPALVAVLAAELHRAWPAFPVSRFNADAATGLAELALMQRVHHIAAALGRALPAAFSKAATVVDRAVDSATFTGWMTLPCGFYIADRGIDEPHTALPLLARLSPRFPARAGSARSSNTTATSPTPTCTRGPATQTNTCAASYRKARGHAYRGPANCAA